jgi:D-alanine-D-alanine ligase
VPGEVIPSREFYDYEAKYLDSGSQTLIPADLPAATADEIRRLSIAAFQAIDGAGMARVDFLLARGTGGIFINEVNTIPGFTTISMYSKLWAASGVPYPALLDRLIALALERHAEKQRLRTSVT